MRGAKEGAAKRRPSGPSGKSGVNKQPRVTLRATPEEFAAWEAKAAARGTNLNQWIRDACNKAKR